ncbi:MAG: DUF4236 domain-containing protein [Alphaproteobacteria bacterium]|nr:DUF4236 domain-containing protein [Alphaproteobacteria bacterium]
MGFRFRKGVRILPGLRLNITKHGISSLTIGGKGLTYNIGKKGTRATGGLPGTGLSYSEYSAHHSEAREQVINPETGEITEEKVTSGPPWVMIAMIALVLLVVYTLRS